MNTHSGGQGRGWTNRYLPQLEGLESRCCPTTAKLVGHTLLILGDQHDNTVLISDDGTGEVTVTFDIQSGNASASNDQGENSNGNGTDTNDAAQAQVDVSEQTFTGAERIDCRTFGGDDLLAVVVEGALAENRAVLIDTGKGDDIINLDLTAGVSGEKLKVNVITGAGDDLVQADFGAVDGTDLRFRANLGKGDDQLAVTMSGDITGDANVKVDVDLGK